MTQPEAQRAECEGCGRPTAPHPIPDDMHPRFAAVLRRLPVWCPICLEKDRMEEEKRQEEERAAVAARRVEAAGIPTKLRRMGWRDLDKDERVGAIHDSYRWAVGTLAQPGLLLHGPIGAGKSQIAAIACEEFARRRRIRWVSFPVLIAQCLSDGREREVAQEVLTNGRLPLAIDDLDKVKPSEWASQQLFAAIDTRVAEGTPLLVTMNLTPEELPERFGGAYGEALLSRLLEHCRVHAVAGRDRRVR